MTKKIIDYSKTVIYKLVCNDLNVKEIYVGHTTDFTKRKNHHKHHSIHKSERLPVYDYIVKNGGWLNWSMVEIEKFPCSDGNEARARERYWIENLNSTLNYVIPYRSENEIKLYRKTYREINQDKIKAYLIENKDKIKAGHKDYEERNKEKIKEMHKAYRKNNLEKVKAMEKEYRENNKELIRDKKKLYYEQNKEMINEKKKQIYSCECGSTVKIGDRAKHFKSNKHKNFCLQIS